VRPCIWYGTCSRPVGDDSAVVPPARGLTEEEKVDIGDKLQNLLVRSGEQRALQAYSVYRWSNTVNKYLQGAGWKVLKGGLIPILVRGPKNSVLLHPGD
jgi:hypothetical protein